MLSHIPFSQHNVIQAIKINQKCEKKSVFHVRNYFITGNKNTIRDNFKNNENDNPSSAVRDSTN